MQMNGVALRAALILPLLAISVAAQVPAGAPAEKTVRQLSIRQTKSTGDFDAMLERRLIRVAVPYSRTLFYFDKGHERGITAEGMRDFERWINRKYAKRLGKRPISVHLIPTTRDKLIQNVADGIADIAAGNITVTDQRLNLVDFTAPEDQRPVSEVVVTRVDEAITGADDLSGEVVDVRPSSSYHSSLEGLNARLAQEGKAPVKLIPVPDELEDEDMLEMLNAGLMRAIVVDDWKAKIWAQILPNLKVNETATVREGAVIGWAIRKHSPKLHAELIDFYKVFLKRQGVYKHRMQQAMRRVKQIKNNATSSEYKKFQNTIALFKKYGAMYHFDYLMLAAQGYQESKLNQEARSRRGAIGVMQLMPATGADLKVGDIRRLEPNIHGGTKYMDRLITRYYNDANFTEDDRTLFALASYNAGPGRISRIREEAAKRGLDPDKWFNNVEVVTAEKIGIETTTYVRNIYKYYVFYKLSLEASAGIEKAKVGIGRADRD
jgi:membrane-bound lytic murein transglycosylase MltF